MAFVHGKNTVVTLNAKDLSAYSNKSTMTREADEHDVTTFGASDYSFQGGLLKGDASLEGTYDNSAANGPRGVIEPLIGTTTTFTRKPEGTGVGKPLETCTVLVKKYVETSPVADMVTWSVELKISGAVTLSTQ